MIELNEIVYMTPNESFPFKQQGLSQIRNINIKFDPIAKDNLVKEGKIVDVSFLIGSSKYNRFNFDNFKSIDDNIESELSKEGSLKFWKLINLPDIEVSNIIRDSDLLLTNEQVKDFGNKPIKVDLPKNIKEVD